MAISAPHYQLLKSIKPVLPVGGSLLEIGEANWYGDVEPDFPCSDKNDPFAVAKDFYADLFAPSSIVSVDMGGTHSAIKRDLNLSWGHDKDCPEDDIENTHGLPCTCQNFDVVINHGTAEHIFNIAQVFATIHDRTAPRGLMIHESPFTGWIDHGFYCLQPTLFYDLAAANCYEIVLAAIESIDPPQVIRLEFRDHVCELAKRGGLPANAMLFVAFRKMVDRPFQIPMQGVYAGALSAVGKKAWEELR